MLLMKLLQFSKETMSIFPSVFKVLGEQDVLMHPHLLFFSGDDMGVAGVDVGGLSCPSCAVSGLRLRSTISIIWCFIDLLLNFLSDPKKYLES